MLLCFMKGTRRKAVIRSRGTGSLSSLSTVNSSRFARKMKRNLVIFSNDNQYCANLKKIKSVSASDLYFK